MKKNKDSKGRVLRPNERERKDGYEYRWVDQSKKRRSIFAKDLNTLREKEKLVLLGEYNNSKLTVDDYFRKWKALKVTLRPNTLSNYIYIFEKYIFPYFGNVRITNLKKSDIKLYYAELLKTLSMRTVESIQIVFYQILQLAVEDEIIKFNPSSEALRNLKKTSEIGTKEALTLDEQKRFLSFLKNSKKNHRWYIILSFLFFTGLRIGELMALTWNDVDWDNKTLSINKTLVYYQDKDSGKCCHRINNPKTRMGMRVIPLCDMAIEVLKEEKNYHNFYNINSNVELDGYKNFIFLNRNGGFLSRELINRTIKRLVKECNNENVDGEVKVREFSCHLCRHSFATRLNESNVNLKARQAILGHKEIETTINIYTSVSNEVIEDATEKINNLLI